MNKNKHLVLDERYVIEHSLNKNMSFKAIGKLILKDCTTVSKEVKSHIVFEKKGLLINLLTTALIESTVIITVIYATPANVIKAETNVVSVVIVQPLVQTILKRNVPNYPRLHMYVTGVICHTTAPSKNDSIELLRLKKSMNWCGANLVPALISAKMN